MSDGGVVLREATAVDFPDLVVVWRRAVEATHDFLRPEDVDEIEAEVRSFALPALSVTVAQRTNGDLVGWLGADGSRVEALFVDPATHRQGVGRLLLDSVTASMHQVTLDVNEQNFSARGFYESQGFVVVGRSGHDDQGRPFPLLHMRRC